MPPIFFFAVKFITQLLGFRRKHNTRRDIFRIHLHCHISLTFIRSHKYNPHIALHFAIVNKSCWAQNGDSQHLNARRKRSISSHDKLPDGYQSRRAYFSPLPPLHYLAKRLARKYSYSRVNKNKR